jgi:hypothetical protein
VITVLQSKALELVFEDYISAQKGGWGEVMKSSAPLRNFHKDFTCLESEVPLVSMAVSTAATTSASDLTTTVPIYVELTDSQSEPERPYGHAQTIGHARTIGHAQTVAAAGAGTTADFPLGAEKLPSRAQKRAAAAAAAMAAIPLGGPRAIGHRIGTVAVAEAKKSAVASDGPTLADLTSATPLYVDTEQPARGHGARARHAAAPGAGSVAGADLEARSLVRLPSLEATRNAIMKSMDAGYQDASIVSLIKILGK